MDPVTTAIVAALSAGVTAGTTDVGKKALVDAYDGLKDVIKKKFGKSEIPEAIEKLEDKPNAKGRQMVLQEEIESAQADKDSETIEAAKNVTNQINPQQTNQIQMHMDAKNSQGAIQAGNIGTVIQNKDK